MSQQGGSCGTSPVASAGLVPFCSSSCPSWWEPAGTAWYFRGHKGQEKLSWFSWARVNFLLSSWYSALGSVSVRAVLVTPMAELWLRGPYPKSSTFQVSHALPSMARRGDPKGCSCLRNITMLSV